MGFLTAWNGYRSLYIILSKFVWMKNCAQTYIIISRSQFSSACFDRLLCSTFKWYMIPKTHHTHFGLFFRYLLNVFFYSLHVHIIFIIMVGLVWSILFEYVVLKWKRWEKVTVLRTYWNIKWKCICCILLFTKHWASMTSILYYSVPLNSQCSNI